MNSFVLLHAFSGIDPDYVSRAQVYLGLLENAEKPRRRNRTRLRVLLLAAALSLLLAACGYAIYRATMQHRQLQPTDEMRYYYKGMTGLEPSYTEMRLNFGECALALQFDTEAEGYAHAFRVGEGNGLPAEWEGGGGWSTLRSFFNNFTPEINAQLLESPVEKPVSEEMIRTVEQSLKEAGVTAEEAETWYKSTTYSYGTGGDSLKLRIDLFDGAWLHGLDLICGWPSGEATIIREGMRGEYQILEAVIATDFGEAFGREETNYLFLFHPTKQYLLSLAAPADTLNFEDLETIADSLEILDTGFSYRWEHSGTNWSVLAFANG